MIGWGWLTLRQAQEALAHGRLEEAQRLLGQNESLGRKGASALLQQVARGYVERGCEHLRHRNAAAAWKDLQQAERIGAADCQLVELRQALNRLGMEEARKLLEAGEPTRAAAALAQLLAGPMPDAEAQLLEEAAKKWSQARDLALRGEIGLATENIERVRQLLPRQPPALERFRKDLDLRRPLLAGLTVQLHEAATAARWRDVIRLAEQVLALAPQHDDARRARARAWKAVEPAVASHVSAMEEKTPSQRFLLWIDGAGGYLVCLGSRVTIGQAAAESVVDIPLLADISRNHATLSRDTEGYMLEAVRALQVNSRSTQKALLQPGDQFILGSDCRLRFCQPVPISASARLDLLSGHRLPLAVDGVILMAETLVLGAGTQSHISLPDVAEGVVLFRQKDGLGVRHSKEFAIDGRPCRDRGVLGPSSQVQGDDFAFAVEPVGTRMGRT
jgi:hypothetical protein